MPLSDYALATHVRFGGSINSETLAHAAAPLPHPHIRDALLAETGGNPLFLTELLQEPATPERLPDTMPIPPSLPVLIGRRLRQLPESGRQVNVEPDQQAVLHELAT